MKILICTQTVDSEHPILGFFYRWIEEFAEHCELVHVVCLWEGKYELPENVYVHTLGKETGGGRIRYLLRLYRYTWSLRKEYDLVFVHMIPQYVVLLGFFWRIAGKKIILWYSHRSITLWLRLAKLLTHQIFSTTPHAMRLSSKKVRFIGHGVDLSQFPLLPVPSRPTQVLYVGRITHIKRIELMIDTFLAFQRLHPGSIFHLIGDVGSSSDEPYRQMLLSRIPDEAKKSIIFHGSVPHREILNYLKRAHVFYNFSPTGGMDKAVLEALASGVPAVVTNEAFVQLLDTYRFLYVSEPTTVSCADATERALALAMDQHARTGLRERVSKVASLEKLVLTILQYANH